MTAQPQAFTAQQYQHAFNDMPTKKYHPVVWSDWANFHAATIRAALQQCAKGCGDIDIEHLDWAISKGKSMAVKSGPLKLNQYFWWYPLLQAAIDFRSMEPQALRHSWNGYGYDYADDQCGSDWDNGVRYPDGEFLYVKPNRTQKGY